MGRVGPCNGYRQSWRIDQLERRLTRLALARWNNRWFLGLLAAGFVVLLALLEVTFRRFPSSRDSSGTGPKAGGPNYLRRFATEQVVTVNTSAAGGNASLLAEGE